MNSSVTTRKIWSVLLSPQNFNNKQPSIDVGSLTKKTWNSITELATTSRADKYQKDDEKTQNLKNLMLSKKKKKQKNKTLACSFQ